MTDIVERLRNYARNCGGPPEKYLTWQAADEIERLTKIAQTACNETFELHADNERLRAEFRRFMDVCSEGTVRGRALDLIEAQDWMRARAALEPKP
jgi:hypothetical protein